MLLFLDGLIVRDNHPTIDLINWLDLKGLVRKSLNRGWSRWLKGLWTYMIVVVVLVSSDTFNLWHLHDRGSISARIVLDSGEVKPLYHFVSHLVLDFLQSIEVFNAFKLFWITAHGRTVPFMIKLWLWAFGAWWIKLMVGRLDYLGRSLFVSLIHFGVHCCQTLWMKGTEESWFLNIKGSSLILAYGLKLRISWLIVSEF